MLGWTCFQVTDTGIAATSAIGSTTDNFHDTYAFFNAQGKLTITQF